MPESVSVSIFSTFSECLVDCVSAVCPKFSFYLNLLSVMEPLI
jgi:hypothetical protein